MLRSKITVGKLVFTFFAGAIIGTLAGKLIALALPDGVVKDFFLVSVDPGFSPATLDIGICTLTFGLTLHINMIGVIGIIVAIYILRWY